MAQTHQVKGTAGAGGRPAVSGHLVRWHGGTRAIRATPRRSRRFRCARPVAGQVLKVAGMWGRIKLWMSEWGSNLTFAGYVWRLAWLLLPPAVGGMSGYYAMVADWLNPGGPLAWLWAAAIGASFPAVILAWLYSLIGSGRIKRASARFTESLAATPHYTNPLDMSYADRVIDIADLIISRPTWAHPQINKLYSRCIFRGPGTIALEGCSGKIAYPQSNFVWYNKHGLVFPDVLFRDCRFVDCRFIGVTVFVSRLRRQVSGLTFRT
jgi:hypothetical protein